MKRIASAAFVSLALTACASDTGIVPMGRDTFMIAKRRPQGSLASAT